MMMRGTDHDTSIHVRHVLHSPRKRHHSRAAVLPVLHPTRSRPIRGDGETMHDRFTRWAARALVALMASTMAVWLERPVNEPYPCSRRFCRRLASWEAVLLMGKPYCEKHYYKALRKVRV